MTRLLSMLLLLGLVALLAQPQAQARKYRKVSSKRPPVVQSRFSFIAPSQPSPTLSRLQTALTARIVEQQAPAPPVIGSTPTQYQQIFLTHAQLASLGLPSALPDENEKPLASQNILKPGKRLKVPKMRIDYATRSWVSDLEPAQAASLAENLVPFLASQLPPTEIPIILAVPKRTQRNHPFHAAFKAQLGKAGYALAESQAQAPKAHLLRYQVSALEEGLWVQAQVNQTQINRFYPINSTHQLMATHPFTVQAIQGDFQP